MDKYVCIHGHFYQPPRENPWLEDVELQDSAYPYHDWNAKITEESYRTNAASRILSSERKIINIVCNYEKMSFDFGPTLLIWLQRHAPDVYEAILEADRQSQKNFSGHGSAIAQSYNHIIMPLANRRDKITQVIWGLTDFEQRFKRKSEGMWLSETAVDLETLDILAENNIKFTILSPGQVKRIRKIGDHNWQNVNRDSIDTSRPYLCKLPSGRTIALFFYHGATAGDVANGSILRSGELFAGKLMWLLEDNGERARLAHIATDGETFGHHHRYTDMALAYCTHYIQSNNLAKFTNYGEYLEKFPPAYEAEIFENSSWSCIHGVERWRRNCGCHLGRYPSGKQQWRQPLREAMDWLRDRVADSYEKNMAVYTPDPWLARNEYISVINDRSHENINKFMEQIIGRQPANEEKIMMLKLLEQQRNAMLMFTSCGWFFDDIAGIETVQILQYASRTIQLDKEISARDLETQFESILENAPCNVKEYENGKKVYQMLVKNTSIDLNRVGAHLAASLIFEEFDEKKEVYCYSTKVDFFERIEMGIQVLAVGRATIQSNIVLEKHLIDFAVLHFGDHNLICSVYARSEDRDFEKMKDDLKTAFARGDTTEVMRVMSIFFRGNNYSLWHLFKDQQRRVLNQLLSSTWEEIEATFRHIYEHNFTIMQIMRGIHMPLPSALCAPAEFIINKDLCNEMRCQETDLPALRKLADQVVKLCLRIDTSALGYEASHKINYLMGKLENSPEDIKLIDKTSQLIGILLEIVPDLNLHTAQNILFVITRKKYPEMNIKAKSGDQQAQNWCDHFRALSNYLGIKVD